MYVIAYLVLLSGTDELETEAFKILLQINRWMVVGVFGIYIIPLTIYSVLFKSFRPLVEAMKGALSFVFYNPTYIIILNFYALCRIDDISWGTKGLTNQNSKQSKMQEKWRLIKLIHVAKYVIWNIIASVLLITFAELPSPRFYIAFVIMISIVVTIGIKIFVGSIYLFLYKCKNLTCCGGTEII
jgi:chitin synthase